jgi:uncharacterized protein
MRFFVGSLLQEPVGAQMDFELDMGFQHLSEDLAVGGVKGRVHFSRASEGILAHGVLAVGVDLECVRCLSPTIKEIRVELSEYFHPPSLGKSPDDQVLFIDADGYLDIGSVLRELVIVSTPMHVLCKPDCKGMCPECGQDLNKGPCDCRLDEIDPRMASLQALLIDGVGNR